MATAKRKIPTASDMGKKGGKARWKGVSAAERRTVARKAAAARWAKVRAKKSS